MLSALHKHKNHDIRCVTNYGGLCDCGDVTAYKPQVFCECHSDVRTEYSPDSLKYFYASVV